MRIGVLTAGGDAPGLNAAIRSIGSMAFRDGHELIGIENGWAGLAQGFTGRDLTPASLEGILGQGGTLLGTARYDLDSPEGGRLNVLKAIDEHLDALVAIGGDGTQRISHWLAERGAPVVGVPKTLDNDLLGTDYCIGFDTAVSIVAESLDRLYTTAASHHRVMIVETMGRATGWVAASVWRRCFIRPHRWTRCRTALPEKTMRWRRARPTSRSGWDRCSTIIRTADRASAFCGSRLTRHTICAGLTALARAMRCS